MSAPSWDTLHAIADHLKMVEERKADLESKILTAAPKVEFFNDAAGRGDAILLANVADVLNIKGMNCYNLVAFLRKKKVLNEDSGLDRKFQDAELGRVVEIKYTRSDGETWILFKTLIYPLGVDFIRRLVTSGGDADQLLDEYSEAN